MMVKFESKDLLLAQVDIEIEFFSIKPCMLGVGYL
jgi:hypothetical protein